MPVTVEHLTKLIQIAILSAIAYVLTLIAIPVIPIAPYLKLDLSDLPILVGTVTMGIESGIAVAALTTFLHLLMTGFALPSIIGNAVMFLSAVTILLTVGVALKLFAYRLTAVKKWLLVAQLTVNVTIVMLFANVFTVPLYMKVVGMTIRIPVFKLVMLTVVPFNIIKGVVIGLLFLLIYRYLSRSSRFDLN